MKILQIKSSYIITAPNNRSINKVSNYFIFNRKRKETQTQNKINITINLTLRNINLTIMPAPINLKHTRNRKFD